MFDKSSVVYRMYTSPHYCEHYLSSIILFRPFWCKKAGWFLMSNMASMGNLTNFMEGKRQYWFYLDQYLELVLLDRYPVSADNYKCGYGHQ